MPGHRTRQSDTSLDVRLRRFIFDHLVRTGRAPLIAQMAKELRHPVSEVNQALDRLCATHAFIRSERGELWRAAPFSAVPTSFTAQVGKRSWWGNCIWDALGILAALHRDGSVLASCGCCNTGMTLHVRRNSIQEKEGLIHFAVPARHWYDDIVFT
jgi:alkylmercury lyase-like protein